MQGVRYEAFPQGIEEIAPMLFELAIQRSKIPLEQIRIHEINLDDNKETEEEELYLRFKDTLSKILATIIQQESNLAKESLQKSIPEIMEIEVTLDNLGQYIVEFYSVLSLYEIFRYIRISQNSRFQHTDEPQQENMIE